MIYSMSYTNGSSNTPLLGATIGDLYDQTVARYPDNEALIARHQGIRYTYRQLQTQVDRCARALITLGAHKGDRLGIWAPNYAEWTITQLACAKIGVILVNVNPSYRLHEVEYALKQSGCAYLVIAPQFKTSDYTQMVYDLAPELARAELGGLRSAKLHDDTQATDEEIRTFCRGQIAHYKIPRYIKFVEAFPMTISGKTQKFVMREQSINELGLAAAVMRTA